MKLLTIRDACFLLFTSYVCVVYVVSFSSLSQFAYNFQYPLFLIISPTTCTYIQTCVTRVQFMSEKKMQKKNQYVAFAFLFFFACSLGRSFRKLELWLLMHGKRKHFDVNFTQGRKLYHQYLNLIKYMLTFDFV